ncbi:MAG: hypothetical protein V3U18_00615 [Alphaproteobacteria bacterium]
MKLIGLITQIVALVLAGLVTAGIHFHLHPLTRIHTVGDAVASAFSFGPGMIIGYLGLSVERLLGKDDPTPSAAAAICVVFFGLGLYRAATLLIRRSDLSDWTIIPLRTLVGFLELFT